MNRTVAIIATAFTLAALVVLTTQVDSIPIVAIAWAGWGVGAGAILGHAISQRQQVAEVTEV